MVKPEIVAITYTRHLTKQASSSEIGGRDMSRLRYPSQVLSVNVHAEQDAACEKDSGHDGLGLGELFPICRIENGVPVFARLDLGDERLRRGL